MGFSPSTFALMALVVVCWFAAPAYAFGAGNIASISTVEGSRWRHGDIEDALLGLYMARVAGGKKFDALTLKRVYFGNWLRDYSQAIDVGALKMVDKDSIRLLLWILSFMTFGYATEEFELTEERLGCYRPEEHIDNPKDYADNLDAREYDVRLRGLVDEPVELGVDEETGMKNYIANETLGIDTSAGLVRRVLGQSIELGRRYGQTGDKRDLYEAWRLMGTGLHCLEDFSAHSNYTELALNELGECVFTHCGSATGINLNGVDTFPLVTGTFGGTDFLHSVLGEGADKISQSEVQQLEDTVVQSAQQAEADGGESSVIRDILSKIPSGLMGGDNEDLGGQATSLEEKSNEAKANGTYNFTNEELGQQIYPILEFHDRVMKRIAHAIDSIPGLSALMEKLSETISIFVFSLIAPYILPIMSRIKVELAVASEEVINSSKDKQHIVFHDPYSSNPTHSMLSKDHFSNLLNEPAGKIASAVVKYAVPLLMQAWDDESFDPIDDILGIFHHPVMRDPSHPGQAAMFAVVEEWWGNKTEEEREFLRDALSADGVECGRNHNGEHDTGHGCGAPLAQVAHNSHAQAAHTDFGGKIGEGIGEALGGGAFGMMAGGLAGGYIASQMASGGGGGFGGFGGFGVPPPAPADNPTYDYEAEPYEAAPQPWNQRYDYAEEAAPEEEEAYEEEEPAGGESGFNWQDSLRRFF